MEAKDKLEAARARRAKAAEERAALEAQAALERQVREEEIEASNEEALLDADANLGERGIDWGTYTTPSGIVILKRPKSPAFKAFSDAGKYSTAACHTLVAPCVHYPERSTFDDWTERFPGLLVPLANVAVELASGKRKETEGKS